MSKTELLPHPYHCSWQKRLFDRGISILGLIILSPLFIILAIIIKLSSKGPVFFIQKRVGEKDKIFKIIKFRVMEEGAERQQWRYLHLNEADGPVFKIRDDPRFTRVGKFIARAGLDEVAQLINVAKGEMSLVGPRPLPVSEAKKLTPFQNARHLIKPGVTSSWVVKGPHSMKFKKWMQLDRQYVLRASFAGDVAILVKTLTSGLR